MTNKTKLRIILCENVNINIPFILPVICTYNSSLNINVLYDAFLIE